MSTTDLCLKNELESEGYVVLRDVLDVERDLWPVELEYSRILDGLTERMGVDTPDHTQPFSDRLCDFVRANDVRFDRWFDISLPQADVTPSTPMHTGPAIFALLRCPRLLDAVEQFIGPEIYCNPVQHTRMKLPASCLGEHSRSDLTGDVAWHQDQAVITEDADDTELLTVWIPMTSATLENGCMVVSPGSHRNLAPHCRSRRVSTLNQLSIPRECLADQTVNLPMEPGDVLFMHRRTQHSSLPNCSEKMRWSFDLRYQPVGQPSGRRWFPGFIARSRTWPTSELTDAGEWSRLWDTARSRLAKSENVPFNRWKDGDPYCA